MKRHRYHYHFKDFLSKIILLAIVLIIVPLLLIVDANTLLAQTRIMPLGNSITRGIVPSLLESYRKDLYDFLNNTGYDFDLVGSLSDGVFADPEHEGHGGWYADGDPSGNDIRPHVYDWLLAHPADIVLLHIGTNDIINGQIRLVL